MKAPRILVVGSLVMDLIVTAKRFPNAGESVFGDGFRTVPGGKGANQAVQAARLGARVTMVGMVGEDAFGEQLIASLRQSGVDTAYVMRTPHASTAIANIQIQQADNGTQNRIVVVLGANNELCVEDVRFLEQSIADYDMVLLQNEIPEEVNTYVAALAKAAGVPVMLNPAPARPLPAELIACLSCISPNEHEASLITGVVPQDEATIIEAAAKLRDMGAKTVLITLGERGCVYVDGEKIVRSPSVSCGEVVDPTAAGDSFVGAFCVATANGERVEDALRFANCTAGLTVCTMGAQTSLPALDAVEAVMQRHQ